MNEGIIKFRCEWVRKDPLPASAVREMNRWRGVLFEKGMIGAGQDGIGFGNISVRLPGAGGFIVSGSQTGSIGNAGPEHYTAVTDYSIERNFVYCEGPAQASSESLTHAAFYEIDPAVQAVVHVHHGELWRVLKNRVPTTSAEVEYGTPAMAAEVRRLFEASDLRTRRIMVMAGHEEGIVSFGADLEQACGVLLDYHGRCNF